jgi:hypothetical protein
MGLRGGGRSRGRTGLSLQFGKSRVILTKCRDGASAAPLKSVGCHEVGWDSPYSRSREATLFSRDVHDMRPVNSRVKMEGVERLASTDVTIVIDEPNCKVLGELDS